MRNWRSAITSLVVAFLMMVCHSPSARADGDKIDLYQSYRMQVQAVGTGGGDADDYRAYDPPEDEIGGATRVGQDEPQEGEGVYAFDFRRTKVSKHKTVVWEYVYSELVLGGGLADTIDDGKEADVVSLFGYMQGSVRFLSINPSRWLSIQLGPRASFEYAAFESGSYEGDKLRLGLQAEAAFLHVHPNPLGSLLVRMGVAYDKETGSSRISNYELDFQESWLLTTEIVLETYVTRIRSGPAYKVWGNQIIRPAWFHAIQLLARVNVQLDESRNENMNGPSTDNTSIELQSVAFIYRGAQPNGEWAVGLLLGCRWHEAAGYNSVDHGDTVPTLQYGVVARFQLWKHLMLNVNATLQQELHGTDRISGTIGANLTLFDW